jgi:hemoglobin
MRRVFFPAFTVVAALLTIAAIGVAGVRIHTIITIRGEWPMLRYAAMKLLRGMSLIAFCLLAAWSVQTADAQEQKEGPKSLYNRLGGAYPIATVVDDFIERLYVDDILNANPAIKEARDRVPKPGLKFRVTSLVCQVTGGLEKYAGRPMKEAHKDLNINEREWQAMLADFKKSLDAFKVPETEQKELFAIVESTKPDIVIKSTTTR